mmetsp:Transcript_52632/g.125742  ORF Transcript_52632/g.125742 Transcript_52632/m.125742 type:complete len:584 (-) Transcript_52632:87-1838(-)
MVPSPLHAQVAPEYSSTQDLTAGAAALREGQKSLEKRLVALESLSQTVARLLAATEVNCEGRQSRPGPVATSSTLAHLSRVLGESMVEAVTAVCEHAEGVRTLGKSMENVLATWIQLEIPLTTQEHDQTLDVPQADALHDQSDSSPTTRAAALALKQQQQVREMVENIELSLQAMSEQPRGATARTTKPSLAKHVGPEAVALSELDAVAFSRIRQITCEMDTEALRRLDCSQDSTAINGASKGAAGMRCADGGLVQPKETAEPENPPQWTLDFRRALELAAGRSSENQLPSPILHIPEKEENGVDANVVIDCGGEMVTEEISAPSRGSWHARATALSLRPKSSKAPSASEKILQTIPETEEDASHSNDVSSLRQHLQKIGALSIAAEADCMCVEAELARISSHLAFQGRPLIGQLHDLADRVSQMRTGLAIAEQRLASNFEVIRDSSQKLPSAERPQGQSSRDPEGTHVKDAIEATSPNLTCGCADDVPEGNLKVPKSWQVDDQKPSRRLGSPPRSMSTASPCKSTSTGGKIAQQLLRLHATGKATRANSTAAATVAVGHSYTDRVRQNMRTSESMRPRGTTQ